MLKKKIEKIVIGSNNKGKIKEIRDLIPKNYKIFTPNQFKLKSPVENGKSFKKNSLIKVENPKNENLLFAGKRVSASVNKGQELPQDFGQASSIVEHGMIDGAFDSRMQIREKITDLVRVLLKKPEIEARAESTSNVKVDLQSAS